MKEEVKMLVISDTHSRLRQNDVYNLKALIDKVDAVFLLGDIDYSDLQLIDKILPKEKTYGVLGNHDSKDILELFQITDIHGKMIEIKGYRIAGWGGTYKYKNGLAISFTQEESMTFADKLPKADILLSHDTFYDPIVENDCHKGLRGISKYIVEKRPFLHIHGHLHDSFEKRISTGMFSYTKQICNYKYNMYTFKAHG